MARATVAVGKSKAMSSSRGKAKGTRNKPARKGVGGNKRKEEEEKEDVEDPDDAIDAVDNNSDDSDYQEEGGDSIGESNEDSDDSDSDFETSAKRKQKKSLPPPPKTSAKKDSGQHNRGTGSNKQGSTAGGGAGPLSNGDGKAASGVAVEKETMTYVWEIAKTSRAMCRRCDEKISKGALKIGVVTEGTWGPSTQWHHLQCTVFRITRPEDIVGFSDLDDALLVRLAI